MLHPILLNNMDLTIPLLPCLKNLLKEGNQIKFGNTVLDILHIMDMHYHVVFTIKAAKIIIGGDVLFRGSIGRTDRLLWKSPRFNKEY